MKKDISKLLRLIQNNWKILGPIILVAGCCGLAYFFRGNIPFVGAETNCASGNTTMSIANTTFIKSYRPMVFTKISSAWPTKDGGYIVSGLTDPNIMFVPPDGFVAKLDKQGNVQWMRLLKTKNVRCCGTMMNPNGEEDVQSIIELKGGGYLMASYVDGFTTVKEFDADNVEKNKILLTKLDKKGNMVWNQSFTAFVEDARNSLLETSDGGFLFHANIVDLPSDQMGEDSDVYQDLPFASFKVLKFDKNGNLQWSKKIKNFIARDNDSHLIPTPDGGYALAGELAEKNPEKSAPYDFDTYPGLVKFDKDFNFEWARSLEGTPLDMAAAIPKAGGGYEMGWKKMRQAASIIHGLIPTQDNGYLVMGVESSALSLITDSQNLNDLVSKPKNSLIGFKFDSQGNMEWVKKMTFGFNEFTVPLTDFSVILTKDGNMMIAGPITWADADFKAKTKTVNDLQKWYVEKYGEMEMLKENKQKTKASQNDWKKVQAAIDAAQDAFRPGIMMMKTDRELNTSWAKIINPQRFTKNYVMKPTSDSGAIIAGEYETTVVQSVMFGYLKIYYKDGFLMKLDASGNVKNNKKWIVDYSDTITTELMTAYSLSNVLNAAELESYPVELKVRKPEFSLYGKSKTSVYALFNSSKNTLCPRAPAFFAYDAPLQNTTSTSSAARTWPQINYERAVSVEPVNDKSRTIHGELLPILNQLYDSQVKLRDNMGGTMLSYIFNRVITKEDIAAVKKSLEGLGYKTQDEGVNQLTMYKPGYFLVMTFSLGNLNKAFLDITY